jgi:hypothetical protein
MKAALPRRYQQVLHLSRTSYQLDMCEIIADDSSFCNKLLG